MDLRALFFVPALVGAVIFGFVFLLFACHYYLTVVESSATGAKDVTWVSESVLDNFWKFWYLAWLVGLWFGPAYLIGRAAAGSGSPWVGLFVPLAVLWVCYPVSQLSSLSASSIWMPLAPDVFVRLAQKPLVVLQFYVLSGLVLMSFGVGFRWTFQTEGAWELLFVGAPVLVVSALVYARLLGRLAFVLRFTKGIFQAKKKKPKTGGREADPPAESPKRRTKQPRDLPPVETPDGALEGYEVRFDDAPLPPRKRIRAEVVEIEPESESGSGREQPVASQPPRRTAETAVDRARVWTDEDDDDATAYGVHEAEVKTGDAVPAGLTVPTADEVRLLSRDDVPKKPKRLLSGELFAFFGQPGTVGAVVIASSLCWVVGVMVRVARSYNPAAGGG